MAALFSMDWTCCRCQHLNDSCTKCVCQHSYCHECADALGCVAHGSVIDAPTPPLPNHHNHSSPPPFTSVPPSSWTFPSYASSSSRPNNYPPLPPPSYSTPASSPSSPKRSKSNVNPRPATAIPHILPPQELVAPFATPRNSVSLTSLTTTITTNNPVPPPTRRRFFPSISVQDLGSRRRRSKSPQHRKTPSATPSIDDDFDKPPKVSRIDRWWIDL